MRVFKLFRYLLYGVGGLLALLLLGLVALFIFIDPNDYRPQIQRAAAEAGVRLELAGDIGWRFYPYLGFDLNQVRLYPHDSDEQLLELGGISLSLSLLDLIAGRIQVSGIAVRDTEVALRTDEQGQGNWEKIIKPSPEAEAAEESPGQQKEQEQRQEEESPEARAPDGKPELPPQLAELELGFFKLENVKLSYADAQSGLDAGLHIANFAFEDFRFGQWFKVKLQLAVQLNNPATDAMLSGYFEAMAPDDLELVQLRGLKLEVDAATQPLGVVRQELELKLASLLFDLTAGRINIKSLELLADAVLPQLGESRQKVAIATDLNFGLEAQQLGLSRFSLDGDLAVPQLGEARQKARLAGEVNLGLKNMALSVPQLQLNAQLTYPQLLTQQLVVDGTVAALSGDLNKLDLNIQQLALDIAGLLQLTLKETNLAGESMSLQSQLSTEPFNPKQVMELVKLDDKKLSSLLPQTADPAVLQKLQLATAIKATPDPLATQLDELTLALDDSTLKGKAGLEGTTSFTADLKLDSIDLDRYLPPQGGAPAQSQQESGQSAPADNKEGQGSAGGQPSAETIYSKEPILPVDLLRAFNIDAALAAGKVVFNKQAFTDIQASAHSNGEKATARLQAKGFEGAARVAADISKLAATPALAIDLDFNAIDLRLAQSLALDEPLVAGKGKVSAKLKASGVSIHDWVHSLGGPLAVNLGEGQLLGMNISKTFCEAASKAQGKNLNLDSSGEHTSIERMQLALAFNGKGKGEIDKLDLAIPDLGVTADGHVDLPQLAFKVPLQIGVTGNTLDESCRLPKAIKLPLVCEGRLFKDDPLSFCRPDLSSLELRLDDLLEAEKEKIQQQLEEEKRKAQEKLEAEKRKAEEKLAAEKRKAQEKLEAEKRKAREKAEAEKRKAQEKLEAEKRKAEEKAKDKLKDELKKLF